MIKRLTEYMEYQVQITNYSKILQNQLIDFYGYQFLFLNFNIINAEIFLYETVHNYTNYSWHELLPYIYHNYKSNRFSISSILFFFH